jgi:hypothetical protein
MLQNPLKMKCAGKKMYGKKRSDASEFTFQYGIALVIDI